MSKQTKPSAWADHPDYYIDIKPVGKRIQILFNTVTIVDSVNVLVLQESDYSPVYYFPRQEVNMQNLESIDKETFCPYKGSAEHWALQVDNERIEVAAWSYSDPFPEVRPIKSFIAFYPEVTKGLRIN